MHLLIYENVSSNILEKIIEIYQYNKCEVILYKMCRFVLYVISQTKRYCDHNFFLIDGLAVHSVEGNFKLGNNEFYLGTIDDVPLTFYVWL